MSRLLSRWQQPDAVGRTQCVTPERAGWVVGIAAGAAGATIVALHCASNDMIHIALWHGLAVLLSGIAGRVLLAPLLRW